MTNRVTFFGALALAIGCSVAGYQYAAALYGEDVANFKLEAAIVRANDGRKESVRNFVSMG